MKYQFSKQTVVSAAMCGVLVLFADNAVANVAFNSYATINFSVESITTSAIDYSDLEMSGSFMRSGEGFPGVFTTMTGDAGVTDNNPEIPSGSSPVAVGSVFAHTFALNGQASDGLINFNQVGWYDLGFVNNGLESFDITLNFTYTLSSDVVGQEGNTGVRIEYWDDFGDVSGLDEIVATSQVPDMSTGFKTGGGTFTFTLDSVNNAKMFYLDANHTGYLEASPVPLPAAAWSFLAGLLGLLGINKRKQLTTQQA